MSGPLDELRQTEAWQRALSRLRMAEFEEPFLQFGAVLAIAFMQEQAERDHAEYKERLAARIKAIETDDPSSGNWRHPSEFKHAALAAIENPDEGGAA